MTVQRLECTGKHEINHFRMRNMQVYGNIEEIKQNAQ